MRLRCLYKKRLCFSLFGSHSAIPLLKRFSQIQNRLANRAYPILLLLNLGPLSMGVKRTSAKNSLFGWMRKQSLKVKIFLGALLAFCALITLKYTIKESAYFFIASEAIHIVGIILLFYKLLTLKTCSGLSLRTQELTALYLAVRLYCSTIMEGNIHTVLDLTSLFSTLLVIYMMRFKLKSSYIKELDNLRLSVVVVPAAILAILVHPRFRTFSFSRVLWAFCVYLEAVSVLPQVRMMQNAKMVETFTGYYVFALGVSRFLQLAHWIIQIYDTRGEYIYVFGRGHIWFLVAFISELVQSFILADFCYYYVKSYINGQLLMRIPV